MRPVVPGPCCRAPHSPCAPKKSAYTRRVRQRRRACSREPSCDRHGGSNLTSIHGYCLPSSAHARALQARNHAVSGGGNPGVRWSRAVTPALPALTGCWRGGDRRRHRPPPPAAATHHVRARRRATGSRRRRWPACCARTWGQRNLTVGPSRPDGGCACGRSWRYDRQRGRRCEDGGAVDARPLHAPPVDPPRAGEVGHQRQALFAWVLARGAPPPDRCFHATPLRRLQHPAIPSSVVLFCTVHYGDTCRPAARPPAV